MVIYSTSSTFDVDQRMQAGLAALQQNRLQDAWTAFDAVLRVDGANALAWHLMGLVFVSAGQPREAAEILARAVALNPADAVAHNNLAEAVRTLGDYEAALEGSERALKLDPGFVDAHLTRGNALQDLNRAGEAVAAYDAALRLSPDNPKALSNRGLALRALNRLDEAIASFDRAVALDPLPEIRANTGFAYLARGELPKGFGLFEARWQSQIMSGYLESRAFAAPFWRGDVPLAGKTLLLHSEQGFGDILQFSRYAALAKAAGARVLIEVDPALEALMRTLTGIDQVVAQGRPLPTFDLHCPVMSLPFAFGTTLQTIPGETPYLHADPARIAAWAQRLGPKTRPRVGLAWSSGVRPDQPELRAVNGRRNIPLAGLTRLNGAPVEFVSLQKGQPAEGEFAALDQAAWRGPPIAGHAAALTDFAETAALMANLDLIVSVDTAIPHLAGALGRPVWVMNRFDPCWRWLQDRADSPWYPTARLFRQQQPGDWDGVLDEVRGALAAAFG